MEVSCKISIYHLSFVRNLLLLHFGVEVEINRTGGVSVAMSIFKFIIEDTQT